ncbi:hypothetical protein FB451DRAFT_1167387 [Mycena latifolia]|nr:hypothetical protein FB451DRAFT_1167387 [Mycena latifolia]
MCTVKKNKDECVQLMENIHEILYAIVNLHMKPEIGGSLPPTTLKHIGKFTEYFHNSVIFLGTVDKTFQNTPQDPYVYEVQQNGNKIKHFFRQNEIRTLLKECWEGLQQALDVFKMVIHDHCQGAQDS